MNSHTKNTKEYIKYKCKYLNLKLGTKHIYIMRHGETEFNKLNINQGEGFDVPLNDNGKEQARKTGMYFKKYRMGDGQFDCIISSPLLRAKQTANIIKETIGFTDDITYIDDLVERKNGQLAGKTRDDDLQKKYWALKEKYMTLDDPIERYINEDLATTELNEKYNANVETNDELELRAIRALNKIITRECNKILIVAHGGILLAMLRKIFNIPRVPVGDLTITSNCWITYVVYNDKYGYKMISPIDTSHLALF